MPESFNHFNYYVSVGMCSEQSNQENWAMNETRKQPRRKSISATEVRHGFLMLLGYCGLASFFTFILFFLPSLAFVASCSMEGLLI